MTTSDSPPLEFDAKGRAIALPGAEELLLKAVKTGGEAKISDRPSVILPLAWPADDVIRADFLRHVCLNPDLYEVDPWGIRISGALIKEKLDLSFCAVKRPLVFSGCRFEKVPDFSFAHTGVLQFTGSFLPGLTADGLKAEGGVFLRRVIITGETRLAGADIQGQLSCDGARFINPHGDAFFAQDLKVAEGLSWRKMLEPPVGGVNFTHARVGTFVDDGSGWPEAGKLWLDGFTYKRFAPPTDVDARCKWLHKMPTADEKSRPLFYPQPYEQAIKVFKESGHEHEARKVAIAKQDAYVEHLKRTKMNRYAEYLRRRATRKIKGAYIQGRGHFSKRLCLWFIKSTPHIRELLWLKFIKKTAGYGYEPWRAVIFSLLIVLIGWMVFSVTYNNGYMVPSKERVFMHACYVGAEKDCAGWMSYELRFNKNKKLVIPADYPEFNPFVYSLDTFVPIVDLHQENYWSITSTTWFVDGFARFWLWTHIIAGWVLTTIAVAGFSGVLKKD